MLLYYLSVPYIVGFFFSLVGPRCLSTRLNQAEQVIRPTQLGVEQALRGMVGQQLACSLVNSIKLKPEVLFQLFLILICVETGKY